MCSFSHEYLAAPSNPSHSKAHSAQGPENNAHRAPLERPRRYVIVTKPGASQAGSVAGGFGSGYDEPRPPYRIPNVNSASRPPIAMCNARGGRPRSNSRYRREGTENSRSSSASRDSGIGMDKDRTDRPAWMEDEQLLRRGSAHLGLPTVGGQTSKRVGILPKLPHCNVPSTCFLDRVVDRVGIDGG
jgi:hypothetical protein